MAIKNKTIEVQQIGFYFEKRKGDEYKLPDVSKKYGTLIKAKFNQKNQLKAVGYEVFFFKFDRDEIGIIPKVV